MTVYWVVWDAGAHWIVENLVRAGQLPAVRRMWAAGCRAGGRPPRPNCQTSPSLATLFTGAPSQEHGVTGFTVPDLDTVAGELSGFDPRFPARPPVWRIAAEHGLRAAFVHVPWVFDDNDQVDSTVVAAIEGYRRKLCDPAMLAVGEGRTRWPVPGLEESIEVEPAESRVMLYAGGLRHELTADTGWLAVRITAAAGCWVRLLQLPAGPSLVRTGIWLTRTAGTDSSLAAALTAGPVFSGEGLGGLYREGIFGDRLVDGGDGSAEEEFLASVGCVISSFAAAAETVLAGSDAELTVIYLPWTDDVGHELAGWCDARSAAYRPELAERIWQWVGRAYAAADEVLGRVLARADEQDTVVLSADHGIIGGSTLVFVNEALIQAGLAVRASTGGLDVENSLVIYHPANNGMLRVNHAGLGGPVPAHLVGSAMRRAMAALASLEVPGGALAVRGFLDATGCLIDPAQAGEISYLMLLDDLQPTALTDGGPVLRPMAKSGAHVVNTGSSQLNATFAATGPRVPAGVDLGAVENTIAARLVLSELIGTPAPAELQSRSNRSLAEGGAR